MFAEVNVTIQLYNNLDNKIPINEIRMETL